MERILIVCDLDGTLSDCQGRQHLAASKDWDGFHELMHQDPPHAHVLTMLKTYIAAGHGVTFMTGRPEEFRETTVDWLDEVCDLSEGTDYLELIMRPKNNFSRDTDLKPELLNLMISGEGTTEDQGFESWDWISSEALSREDAEVNPEATWPEHLERNPEFLSSTLLFLDDRDLVVEMWRNQGYTCWQPAMGAF